MKNNIDPNNTGELLEMAQRYFDATLSKSEERDLMLAVAGSTDPRLDELKAVMAFAACGKAKHRKRGKAANHNLFHNNSTIHSSTMQRYKDKSSPQSFRCGQDKSANC